MADAQFWKAYAKACMDILNNPTLGQDQVVYIASTGERGIAAGKTIPYQITNEGIFSAGDALQNFTDAYFSTSGNDKYSQRLLSYLNWVTTPTGDATAKAAFTQAQTDCTNATNAYLKSYNADMKAYNNDTNSNKGSFLGWASTNDPNLQNLYDNMEGYAGKLEQARKAFFGADAAQLNIYVQNVTNAVNATSLQSGINMMVCDESLQQLEQRAGAQRNGQKQPKVKESDCYFQPVYNLDPTYAGQLDKWATSPGSAQSTSVTMSDGSSFSMTQLGFSSSSSTSFSFGWISWDDSSVQQSASSRSYYNTSNAADISLEVSWTDSALFNIGPGGKWNLDAPSLYPNTSSGFHGTETWARASKLLCASGVTLKLTFSSSTITDFDTDFATSSSSSSSGCSIFGFSFDTSSSSSSSDTSTHTCSYDSTSGTLTISPKPLAQTCTLLGVIANTVTI